MLFINNVSNNINKMPCITRNLPKWGFFYKKKTNEAKIDNL